MNKYFRLTHLKIVHNNNSIFDINFLNGDNNTSESFYTSVIIGMNGCGKSYLLKLICDIFILINDKCDNTQKDIFFRYDFFNIEYIINKAKIKISYDHRKINFYLDGVKVDTLNKSHLPCSVLASSYMLGDKFTFSKPSNYDGFYHYLGVRQVSNAAWISSIEKRVFEHLEFLILNNKTHLLVEMFELLRFSPKITLIYTPKIKSLLNRKITTKTIIRKYKSIKNSDSKSKLTNYQINNVNVESFDNLIVFIKEKQKKSSDNITYHLDLLAQESMELFLEEIKNIKILLILGYIENPKIQFKKLDHFNFDDSSPGEKNIIFTLIGILSKIRDQSLILIDEPEISLHPNWQLNYIILLRKIFKEFPSCHFILGTHSHFIISGLDIACSSVNKLYINDFLERKSEILPSSPYGWSIEQILYEIFNVKTNRNYYVENDVQSLISAVSNNEKNKEFYRILQKLNSLELSENDPLFTLLQRINGTIK